MLTVPSNFRRLRDDEIIKAEDIYVSSSDRSIIGKPSRSIGMRVQDYYRRYEFYRRRHVKAKNDSKPFTNVPKKPVTVVRFSYKNKKRRVQVIKLNERYLIGLEIIQPSGKNVEHKKPTYIFKNFLRNRMDTEPVLEQFQQ